MVYIEAVIAHKNVGCTLTLHCNIPMDIVLHQKCFTPNRKPNSKQRTVIASIITLTQKRLSSLAGIVHEKQ